MAAASRPIHRLGGRVASRSSGGRPGPAHESHSNPGTSPSHGSWPVRVGDRVGRTVLQPASFPFQFSSDLLLLRLARLQVLVESDAIAERVDNLDAFGVVESRLDAGTQ